MDKGLPESFDEEGVKLFFWPEGAMMFFVNESYDLCGLYYDEYGLKKLKLWVHFPHSEQDEGYIADLLERHDPEQLHVEDADFLTEMAQHDGIKLPDRWELWAKREEDYSEVLTLLALSKPNELEDNDRVGLLHRAKLSKVDLDDFPEWQQYDWEQNGWQES